MNTHFDPAAMDAYLDRQAMSTRLHFGRYRNVPLCEVPDSYLAFLLGGAFQWRDQSLRRTVAREWARRSRNGFAREMRS